MIDHELRADAGVSAWSPADERARVHQALELPPDRLEEWVLPHSLDEVVLPSFFFHDATGFV